MLNSSFRSFTHDGKSRLVTFPSFDGLRMQDHLIPVLGSISKALASRPSNCKLFLSIEGTETFEVEWTTIGDSVGVAHLIRADAEAILIAVWDADAVDATEMRSLHTRLAEAFGCDGLDAAFEWLLGDTPPLAALAHVRGKPQIGLDTLGMCLAAVFFDRQAVVDLSD